MRTMMATVGSLKLNFAKESAMLHWKVRRPLAEKLLTRFPKVASALTAMGAKAAKTDGSREPGKLVTMMTASGSIDYVGRDKNSFRFYIRPLS